MIAMKLVLAKLLRSNKIKTDLKMSELELKFEVTLKLCNKYLVEIEPRVW